MEANKHDWLIMNFFDNLLNDESKNEFTIKRPLLEEIGNKYLGLMVDRDYLKFQCERNNIETGIKYDYNQ